MRLDDLFTCKHLSRLATAGNSFTSSCSTKTSMSAVTAAASMRGMCGEPARVHAIRPPMKEQYRLDDVHTAQGCCREDQDRRGGRWDRQEQEGAGGRTRR